MPSDQETTRAQQPDWDESPVTLSMVQQLIEAHPNYRVTGHTSEAGNSYQLIQYADANGEYEEGVPGEFVSWVSNL